MDCKTKLFRKKDIAVIVMMMFFVGILSAVFFGMKNSSENQYAEITINGVSQMKIDLYDGLEYSEIPIDSDSHDFTVAYKDKSIWVKESDCKEQVCVKCGKISSIGASIVCIPKKTVISIHGKDAVDAVTY